MESGENKPNEPDVIEQNGLNTIDIDTTIPSLGERTVSNPLRYCRFVDDDAKVLIQLTEAESNEIHDENVYKRFQLAGPRGKLYFDPSKTKCAVVTCGGLCPGINDVIRSIVLEAYHSYDIAAVFGIRFGLQGFIPEFEHDVYNLTPENVADIHNFGGTMLGSSRGPQDPSQIVDALERLNIKVLFVIGGDGTMRAANVISEEVAKRELSISVIGVPKTIDNDISFISRSFGFDTAVEKATEAIACAHVEAQGAFNGIGMVKVMGRHSGFIAAQATLALREVDFVLVPEYSFELNGSRGLLESLARCLEERRHAVVVVAEGAGQHICGGTGEKDASGNERLADVCTVLRKEIKEYFNARGIRHTLKYIDPSYIIRSVAANSNDRVYCGFLGQNAVHAAMAGKTAMVVGRLQDRYVHLPLHLVTRSRKKMNVNSDYWRAVLEATGQEHIGPNPNDSVEAEDCIPG